MKLSDISAGDTRLYVKSEFGPLNERWPALSFSSRKIAGDFARHYRRERDFVLFVGTGDPDKTENINHRQRLLSVGVVEPRTPITTKDIVPAKSWEDSTRKWGERWEWSLPILKAYDVIGFPRAREVMPEAYPALGALQNLGRCVEVSAAERESLLRREIMPVALRLSGRVQILAHLNTDDAALRKELSRLTGLIKNDVARAGRQSAALSPLRFAPNDSAVYLLLKQKWDQQKGHCALCGASIPVGTSNRLLQMSRDRIDSGNKAYDPGNVQITHLACNLAKSDAPLEEWRDYLAVVRDARPDA